MNDTISREAAIEAVHSTICDFFEAEEGELTREELRLLELNKAITTAIREIPPAAQPEWEELLVICDVCGHAIHVKRK